MSERTQTIYADGLDYVLVDRPDDERIPPVEFTDMVCLGDPHNLLSSLLYFTSADEMAKLLSVGGRFIEAWKVRTWDDDHTREMTLSPQGWRALIGAWAARQEAMDSVRSQER